MTNSRGLRQKVFLLSLLMVLGLALFSGRASIAGEIIGEYSDDSTLTAEVNSIIADDPDANYFKIDVTIIRGNVSLQGFVNSRKTEQRIVAKVGKIRGVKSVNSLLKVEERK